MWRKWVLTVPFEMNAGGRAALGEEYHHLGLLGRQLEGGGHFQAAVLEARAGAVASCGRCVAGAAERAIFGVLGLAFRLLGQRDEVAFAEHEQKREQHRHGGDKGDEA